MAVEYDIKPCGEVADLLERQIYNAIKIDMADAGHMMNIERPDEFDKAVLIFKKA